MNPEVKETFIKRSKIISEIRKYLVANLTTNNRIMILLRVSLFLSLLLLLPDWYIYKVYIKYIQHNGKKIILAAHSFVADGIACFHRST